MVTYRPQKCQRLGEERLVFVVGIAPLERGGGVGRQTFTLPFASRSAQKLDLDGGLEALLGAHLLCDDGQQDAVDGLRADVSEAVDQVASHDTVGGVPRSAA